MARNYWYHHSRVGDEIEGGWRKYADTIWSGADDNIYGIPFQAFLSIPLIVPKVY